jgi:alpha-1,6-mannosyltransferase
MTPAADPARSRALLPALAAWVALAALGPVIAARPAGHRVAPYLALHLALTVAALALAGLARSASDLRAVLVGAVLTRLVNLRTPAFTTTDPARYLWDGAVALAGHDPYALPPLAAQLGSLRGRFPSPLDHFEVATCYPPLAVALFALAAAAGPSLAMLAWKSLVAAASVLTGAAAPSGRPLTAVLLLALPTLLLESTVGAHLDAFVALAVALALSLADRRRWEAAALALGAAIALKYVPLWVLPAFALRAPRRVVFGALALAPLAVSYAGAQALGLTPPGSLPNFAANWSFAAPLWSALYARFPTEDETLRPALALSGAAVSLGLSLRPGPLARNVRDALLVQLIVSPVAYPWYGMSLAVAFAFAPSASALAVLTAMPFSYEVVDGYQSGAGWHPAQWPLALSAAALACGLGVDGWLAWRRRSPCAPG